MGAFFLKHKSVTIEPDKLIGSFKKRGHSDPFIFNIGNYDLFLFKKILIDKASYLQEIDNYIFSTGTFVYRNSSYPLNLKLLLEDFTNSKIQKDELLGTYCILFYVNNHLCLLTDPEGSYQVYYSENGYLISSSFLSISESFDKNLTLNKLAIISNLTTGCSYGEETMFNEIKKLNSKVSVLNKNGDIKLLDSTKEELDITPKTKGEAIEVIINLFQNYFISISKITGNEKINLGLSAGFDSRLLLALALKYFGREKINAYSNYKNPPDRDFKLANEIATTTGLNLFSYPVIETAKMDEETLYQTMLEAMNFYDGQFRTNHGWTRQYRTLKYRKQVLRNSVLELSGHAGELFRNDLHVTDIPISLSNWINYAVIQKQNLIKTENKQELVEYLFHKLKFYFTDSKLNLTELRKFYNEGWVNSGPGIRASIDNQLTYYLSPFTDYKISRFAYHITPFLGSYAEFEKELIKMTNLDLYNLSFEKNKYIFSNIIYTLSKYKCGFDLNYYYRKYYLKRNVFFIERVSYLEKQYSFVKEQDLFLEKTGLIDLKKYKENIFDEGELDRLLALGFVLNHLKNKISV